MKLNFVRLETFSPTKKNVVFLTLLFITLLVTLIFSYHVPKTSADPLTTGRDYLFVDGEYGTATSTDCSARATDTPYTRGTANYDPCKTIQQAIDIAKADGSTTDYDVIRIRGENNAGTQLEYDGIDTSGVTYLAFESFNFSDCVNPPDTACRSPKVSRGTVGTGFFWEPMSLTSVPSARADHTAIWTGSEMIVWGSSFHTNTGGHYNPTADSWIATAIDANTPSGRTWHTAVWTGSEMIVWGGGGYSFGTKYRRAVQPPSTDVDRNDCLGRALQTSTTHRRLDRGRDDCLGRVR